MYVSYKLQKHNVQCYTDLDSNPTFWEALHSRYDSISIHI
jgi:hypothetical protein